MKTNIATELKWHENEMKNEEKKTKRKIIAETYSDSEEDDFLSNFKYKTPKPEKKRKSDNMAELIKTAFSKKQNVEVIEIKDTPDPYGNNAENMPTPKISNEKLGFVRENVEKENEESLSLSELLERKKELADKILDLMDDGHDCEDLKEERLEIKRKIRQCYSYNNEENFKEEKEENFDQGEQDDEAQEKEKEGEEDLGSDEVDLPLVKNTLALVKKVQSETNLNYDLLDEINFTSELQQGDGLEDDGDYEEDFEEEEEATKDLEFNDAFPLSQPVNSREVIVLSSEHQPSPLQQQPVPVRDDSNYKFPWSTEVKKAMTQVFKLKCFRQNQLEAINATLSGKDCFVLMPTGGGKSLCYQLPAIISNGTTSGLTIVISPLLSLIQDQIFHLNNKGVGAGFLSGTMDSDQKKVIFDELNSIVNCNNQMVMRLLYLTPEMINKSPKVQTVLEKLYRSKNLARFVIDEAHCLSQWGHDFRPDYKELKYLREKYPSVPIMALTATANDKVKLDIKVNLKIQGCEEFVMSFNRKNLEYEIVPKSKKTDEQIVDMINTRWPGKSGIIYCTSKKSCEEVADNLKKKFNINARFYHAGMQKDDRIAVQNAWAQNKVLIIVATVAFGMGIDKADVRFVIHYSLPQSLEGYYQETGRAGRDGLKSWCVLFYSYRDKTTIEFLIDKGEGRPEQKERQRDNLRQILLFCENKTECRRVQILSYFGEKFNDSRCNRTCDVCKNLNGGLVKISKKNVTEEAKTAMNVVKSMGEAKDPATLNLCVDIFRGSKAQKILDKGYDELESFGLGQHFAKYEAEILFKRLVLRDFLREECQPNALGFVNSYIRITNKGYQALRDSTFEFWLDIEENAKKVDSGTKKEKKSTGKTESNKQQSILTVLKKSDKRGHNDFDYQGSDDDEFENNYDVAQENTSPKKIVRKEIESLSSECFKELRELRSDIVFKKRISFPSSVYDDSTLLLLSDAFPQNEKEFLAIIPDSQKFFRYGVQFLSILKKYKAKAESIMASLETESRYFQRPTVDKIAKRDPKSPKNKKSVNIRKKSDSKATSNSLITKAPLRQF